VKTFGAKLGFNLGALESLARSLKIQLERQPGEPDLSYQLRLNDAIRRWKKPPPPPPPPEPEPPPPPDPEDQDAIHMAAIDRIVMKFTPADEDAKNTLRLVAASLPYGTNADNLARILGLNRDKFVRPRAKRLRDSGVWAEGQLAMSILHGSEDELRLVVFFGALVAEGLVETTVPEPE